MNVQSDAATREQFLLIVQIARRYEPPTKVIVDRSVERRVSTEPYRWPEVDRRNDQRRQL